MEFITKYMQYESIEDRHIKIIHDLFLEYVVWKWMINGDPQVFFSIIHK